MSNTAQMLSETFMMGSITIKYINYTIWVCLQKANVNLVGAFVIVKCALPIFKEAVLNR